MVAELDRWMDLVHKFLLSTSIYLVSVKITLYAAFRELEISNRKYTLKIIFSDDNAAEAAFRYLVKAKKLGWECFSHTLAWVVRDLAAYISDVRLIGIEPA